MSFQAGRSFLGNLAFNNHAQDDLDTKIYLELVLSHLTDHEQRLLQLLYIDGKTILLISAELKVSRKTFYQWWKSIQQKLISILGNTFMRRKVG
ncbi:DUF1492 domain-containing protein [Fructilactobacillus ixorae]|uniref:DUF1492 domain-containing protein n=1 Tax=Fructilactobacillus ixorae TaxID=1750535 RepID=A0ABY5C4W7_9LACO|nr:DUF1492 domain-containing protein [Fructilactobacillus ixorae]USS93104.1 DUF1492 domain-containing protein [Fructilactobacillus ixorae]